MKVTGIQCPSCKDIIYSRARHDWHACSCKAVYVDGGLDYLHYGHDPKFARPETVVLEVNADKKALYDDWNHGLNKFGLVKSSLDSSNKS